MVLTSITLFTAEAVTLILWLAFMFGAARRLVPALRRSLFPQATDGTLVRFCFFQVIFLALWSVLFKLVLPHDAHSALLLSKGGSFVYANVSEAVFGLGCLVALAWWVRSGQGLPGVLGRKRARPEHGSVDRAA